MIRTSSPPQFPSITVIEKNSVIDQLIKIIEVHESNAQIYTEEIEELKAKIAGLQKAPKKPKIKPSTIEKPTKTKSFSPNHNFRRRGRASVHEEIVLKAEDTPPGSTFKGYRGFVVQELKLTTHNTLFKRERWQTPEGTYILAPLPREYQDFHYGPRLRSFILQQYFYSRVPQAKLLAQLHSWGIELSSGELNHLLSVYTPQFKQETEKLLSTALNRSRYIQTDDTGARHKGQNHICTQVGNHLFTFFETSKSKSRLHFLNLLNRKNRYVFNEAAIDYLKNHGSLKLIELASSYQGQELTYSELTKLLDGLGKNQKRFLEEAAHIGYLDKALGSDFTILSDEARQFKVLNHAACWVHALRLLEKAKPSHNKDADVILEKLRFFYHHLKRYQIKPSTLFGKRLGKYFDLLSLLKTYSPFFDKALFRFFLNKKALLRVLEMPDVPLHNNLSENDIREQVIRRKISGGTRSDLGKDSRDVFLGLFKTCQKLQINFWEFLCDRVYKYGKIPPLSQVFSDKAQALPPLSE